MGKKTEKDPVLMSFIFGCGVKGGGEGELDINKEMNYNKKNIRWHCMLCGKIRCFDTIMCDLGFALEWLIPESLSKAVMLMTKFE